MWVVHDGQCALGTNRMTSAVAGDRAEEDMTGDLERRVNDG